MKSFGAKANVMRTALTAWKLGLAIFLLPYAFVYNRSLLMVGKPMEIALTAFTSFTSIVALAYALEGYFLRPLCVAERILVGLSSVLLLFPSILLRFIGMALFGIMLLRMFLSTKRNLRKGVSS